MSTRCEQLFTVSHFNIVRYLIMLVSDVLGASFEEVA